jgi:hypothetical protein
MNFKNFFNIFVALAILFVLFKFKLPEDLPSNVYEEMAPDSILNALNLKFVESSEKFNFKYEQGITDSDGRYHVGTFPSISVVDINQDGFMDLFIPATIEEKKNLLFINQQGKSFKEEAKKYGIADVNGKTSFSFGSFVDFNKDGLLDLLLVRHGCHELLIRESLYSFKHSTHLLSKYCSGPNGINIFDFNNDGLLDIIFANFLSVKKESSKGDEPWGASPRYDSNTGGENQLLIGQKDGSFKINKKISFLTKSFSHSAGINDVNNDGWNDIFFSNDYSQDQLFINQKGKSFKDETNKYIPIKHHGFSGMNAEFIDYNDDGKIDLYVSNSYKPPFVRKYNLLWEKKEDNTFESRSLELGIAKCGFAWGAKFSDFDNDGDLDLVVVNGRERGMPIDKSIKLKSLWYQRINTVFFPKFLRRFYIANVNLDHFFISAYERGCLFLNENGKFYDVSEKAGFTDTEEGKSVALVDVNNNGKVDFVTVSFKGKARLYLNKSDINGNWVGLKLINKNGSEIPVGAKIKVILNSGRVVVREMYPLHGFRTQNDPRIHIGLKPEEEVLSLAVTWPLNLKQHYKNIELRKYNIIKQETGN